MSKRMIMVGLAGMAGAGVAAAAWGSSSQWAYIGMESGDRAVFYDTESVRRRDHSVRVWLGIAPSEAAVDQVRRARLVEIDCSKRTETTLAATGSRRRLGAAKVGEAVVRRRPTAIEAGSPVARLASAIC